MSALLYPNMKNNSPTYSYVLDELNQGYKVAVSPDGKYCVNYAYNDEYKSLDIYFGPLSYWNTKVIEDFYNKYNGYVVNIPAFGNKIVNVATNGFTIDQKIGLILQSYFKAMKGHRLFETLRICIHESDAINLDLAKWESVLLPFLYQYSQLPLGLKTLNSKQKGIYAGIEKTNYSFIINRNDKASTGSFKQIFISHSKEDCQEADIVYDYLESQGYKCWMDTHDITPGIPYAKEIMKGFNDSSAVVVVVSKNTMQSVGVKNEIDNVYKRNKIIIPFRIDDTPLSDELSFYLSSTQWINAFPIFEEHLEELGKALKQLLK